MLMQTLKPAVLLLLLSGLLPRGARAQEPATVSVRVELVAPLYRDQFTNRQEVETRAAALFADYLSRRVGFLRFAVNDPAPTYRLSFLLDWMDPRLTGTHDEIGFWVRLEGPNNEVLQTRYWLPFRSPLQSLEGAGTQDGFMTTVATKLSFQDPTLPRDSVLRWVPIAEVGLPSLNPLGLVLPFRLLDLCMKRQSVVQFVVEIRGPAGVMEEQYKAQIVGFFDPAGPQTPETVPYVGGGLGKVIDLEPPDELTPSITQKAVTVKQIFVTSYVLDPTACSNRAPSAVGTGTP